MSWEWKGAKGPLTARHSMSVMSGPIRAEPVRGWGVGPQGETLFSTQPLDRYDSQWPYPLAGGGGRPGSSASSDPSRSDDDDDQALAAYASLYAEVDLSRVYGQQLALWCHKSPDTVALFTPVPGDAFGSIAAFARSALQFNSHVDKMMVLLPGYKRPLDMDSVFVVKPGTAILIAPLYDYMVTIEIRQLGQKIDMVLNLTMTVLELKGRLQMERGFPVERTDLLYRDRAMENSRYLFEYGIIHGSTFFVLLALKHDVLIHVETFWGKQYHLYVDRCSTGFSIISTLLTRTVSQMVVDVVKLYELFLPKHTLVLFMGSRVVDWDVCLGFYNIESGHVFRLSTIGLAHNMDIQKVPILLDTGQIHFLLASKFDRWSAVVLKLHGMTGYPVNLMRLVRHDNMAVDFSDGVGAVQAHTQAVRLDVTAMSRDDDLMYGIPLRFKVAKGFTELLKVAPSRTIKSVKDTLERIGVPNASIYDFVVDGVRLSNTKRVVDVIEEYKKPIQVSLRQYPVFIHGPQNVIYRMLAYSKESLATFLMRIKMKTGLSFKDYILLVCGVPLDDNESLPMIKTQVSVKASIFLVPRNPFRIFFILHEDWLTKLRLPATPSSSQIKDILLKQRHVPEGGLASVGNFLQWFFGAKSVLSGVPRRVPFKERMAVYEANVGNKYMHMKVEPVYRRRRAPRRDYRQHEEELEHFRAQSLPVDRPRGRPTRARVPRHLSADARHPDRRHDYRWKTFTAIPAHNARREISNRPQLPAPVYDDNDDDGVVVVADGADVENAGKEWSFYTRHAFPANPNKHHRRRRRH